MAPVIAVTGASGFIGRRVVGLLRASGWPVRVLVRRPDQGLMALGAVAVAGALEDAASLTRLVDGCTAVVHCAGAIRAPGRAEFQRINADGTRNLIAAVARMVTPGRVVLISSLAAREPGLSGYASSKRAAETAALDQAGDRVDLGILRPPAVYGPGDRGTLPIFQQLARGFLIAPRASGARFSLIHVDDLAALIEHLLTVPEWRAEVVEPDDGRMGGYGWADLAAIAERHLRRRVRRIAVPRSLALGIGGLLQVGGRMTRRAPIFGLDKVAELFHEDWCCRQTRSPLTAAWSPRVDFATGFGRTLSWYERAGWL